MIYVVNRHTFTKDTGENVEYVGRPNILGNPFKISEKMSREDSVRNYRGYFYRMLLTDDAFQKAMLRLLAKARKGDLYLVCWCSPLLCHADIIKEYLDAILLAESQTSSW